MFKTIELKKEGRLARLILNRPELMNAMDDVMMEELADALESLKSDVSVQVLLMYGAGPAFSAGGDIKAMLNPNQSINMKDVMANLARLSRALYSLPQITIAVVHGAAAGLGLSLVLGCDTIIVEENSKLAMNFIGIGLVPDGGGHFFLKERVGVPEAKKMIWSGKVMSGQEAFEKGLIDEVTTDGKAAEHGEAYAHQLLSMPIRSMIATKKILHEQKIEELERVLKMESTSQIDMRQTKDHFEGIQAFVEKRKPKFMGE